MKVRIEVDCGNAAFHDQSGSGDDGEGANDAAACGAEVARILRNLATRVESGITGPDERTVFDANGNRVGRLVITGKL